MYYILYVPSGNCCRAWCVGGTWVTIYLKALAYGRPPKAPQGALRRPTALTAPAAPVFSFNLSPTPREKCTVS